MAITMNRYEELAAKIEDNIHKGLWTSGERLPSVRDMGRREGASPATVVEAYELLKARGLVEARERSGFYVANKSVPLLDVPKSSPVLIQPASLNADDLISALRQGTYNPRIFPFGTATPLPQFFPLKALNRCVAQVLRDEPATLAEYRFPPGAQELRKILARRYGALGVKLGVEALVTTGGAIDAIGLALSAVANRGDIVAVETPGYFGIIQLVRSLGYQILEIPLDPERGLTPERFRLAWQKSAGKIKALITVVNFANPLGTLTSDEDKKALVELASDFGVTVIEDDIYGDLAFSGSRPRPLKAFDVNDTVILCGSFAKTISPALRVGFAASKRHAPTITLHKASRASGVSALAEDALTLYLKSGHYERHLRTVRRDYHTLISQYTQAILKAFPAGTRVSRPAGGFILWVQLPEGVDSRLLQARALEKNISVAPGAVFSLTHSDYASYVRINCAIPWNSQSQRAVTRLAHIANELS
jgi:DNA-binding transcriptional MocR family regulator